MRFSGRAKLLIAAALAVTLGLKAVWLRAEAPPETDHFSIRSEAALIAAGFTTRQEHKGSGILTFGTRGRCRMLVTEYAPNGTFDAAIRRWARPVGTLRFIWGGAMTENAPKLLPLVQFFILRELRRVGFRLPRQPIIAVASSSACDPVHIDWSGVARLPE